MIAEIEGVVLEKFEKERGGKKEVVARIFQAGEKGTIDIPLNGNAHEVIVGEKTKFKVRLIPWANERGFANIACRLVGD